MSKIKFTKSEHKTYFTLFDQYKEDNIQRGKETVSCACLQNLLKNTGIPPQIMQQILVTACQAQSEALLNETTYSKTQFGHVLQMCGFYQACGTLDVNQDAYRKKNGNQHPLCDFEKEPPQMTVSSHTAPNITQEEEVKAAFQEEPKPISQPVVEEETKQETA